jgi:heparan-alpha-glucosaminide N-acetyltransferase
MGLASHRMVGDPRLDRLGILHDRDSLAHPGPPARVADGRARDLDAPSPCNAAWGLLTRLDAKPWLGWSASAFKMLAHAFGELDQYVSLGDAIGSLAAVSMAGCLLGTILRRDSDVATPPDRLRWAFTFTIGLVVAGAITDTFEGINKIGATPAWCFWSAALTCLVWMALYQVIDVAGYQRWSILFRPAGANPLLAYFLHPIIVELIAVAGLGGRFLFYNDSSNPSIVIAGSLGMALFVCVVTGLLTRIGLRTRL